MDHVAGLRCSLCGALQPADPLAVLYTCPACRADRANLSFEFRPALVAQRLAQDMSMAGGGRRRQLSEAGMWRYRAALPLPWGQEEEEEGLVGGLRVGGTALVRCGAAVARAAGVRAVWVKDEAREPSGSLKDRASALVAAHAALLARHRDGRPPVLCTASTGNAAAALACMAAHQALPAVIFVPAACPPAKLLQVRMYGAAVVLVEGSYDEAVEAALAASTRFGWYLRTTGHNPYTAEGKKTVAYEIAEQLAVALGAEEAFAAPSWVAVPVGDGNILAAVHKGFEELLALGLVRRLPRLLGVQAEGSAAVHQAWRAAVAAGGCVAMAQVPDVPGARSVADSIEAARPLDPVRAVRAALATGGLFLTVSDAEILAAMRHLAAGAGIWTEPAGAAAWAGVLKAQAQGLLRADETAVVLATGAGLKDQASATAALPAAAPLLRLGRPRAEELDAVAAQLRPYLDARPRPQAEGEGARV